MCWMPPGAQLLLNQSGLVFIPVSRSPCPGLLGLPQRVLAPVKGFGLWHCGLGEGRREQMLQFRGCQEKGPFRKPHLWKGWNKDAAVTRSAREGAWAGLGWAPRETVRAREDPPPHLAVSDPWAVTWRPSRERPTQQQTSKAASCSSSHRSVKKKKEKKARVDGRAAECAPCTLPGSARARNAPAFAFKTGLGDTEMNGETQAGPVNVPFCFTWSKLKTDERTSEKPSKRTNSVSSRERDRGGREEAFHSGASRDTFSSFLRKGPSVFVLQCPTRPVAGAVPSFFTSLHP